MVDDTSGDMRDDESWMDAEAREETNDAGPGERESDTSLELEMMLTSFK
jgi:hypothetical protein